MATDCKSRIPGVVALMKRVPNGKPAPLKEACTRLQAIVDKL